MALQCGEAYGCIDDGLGLWRAWSETDPTRYKVGECEAKWRGFDAEGGRTLGTLFWLAKRYGWRGCWQRGRRTGKSSSRPHPLLNTRQMKIHDILTAIAEPGKSGRLTVSVLHQTLADHFGRCRETIARGFQTSEGLRICADRGPEDRTGG